MTYYGKEVWAALTTPRTMEELKRITGFQSRFIFEGIQSARADGHSITAIPGRWTDDGIEPTIYTRGATA